MYDEKLIELRRTIRQERENKHITQEKLAEMLEVSPSHLKNIESGHRNPSIELLFAISGILNISLDSIIFPKAATQNAEMRSKIDNMLNALDGTSLQFILDVIEAYSELRELRS